MPKRVFLLRHGKSDWSQEGATDHERPLNGRGRKAAPTMGRWILEQGIEIDKIVSSTAVRAYSTASAVALELGQDEDCVVLERKLYLAAPEAYLDALIEHSHESNTMLLVGHNPGISELASRWAGMSIEMPTAALVHVELELSDWNNVDWTTKSRLVDFVRPRELDG